MTNSSQGKIMLEKFKLKVRKYITMSEIMDDYDAGYAKGLLAGFTKSIVLIRHLQRTYNSMECEFAEYQIPQEVLKEAMELIAQKIEPNNNE
jgi:hypothetical protein